MSDLLIRAQEGCEPDPFLLWDSVHKSIEDGTDFVCDWAIAGPGANTLNVGGLQAVAALGTAVYLLLFTDVYCPPDHPLAYLAAGDRRGWWGDGIDVRTDLDEQPLGSLLYLLDRAPMVAAGIPIEQWAKTFATDALAPLLAQGVVASIDVETWADDEDDRVYAAIALYGSDGSVLFAVDSRVTAAFALVWRQLVK
jgi:phage gp46-like protein